MARLKAAPNTNGHPNDETGSPLSRFSPSYTHFHHPRIPLPKPNKNSPKPDPNPPKTPLRLCASACPFFPLHPHPQNRLPHSSPEEPPIHQTKQSGSVNPFHPGEPRKNPVGREGVGTDPEQDYAHPRGIRRRTNWPMGTAWDPRREPIFVEVRVGEAVSLGGVGGAKAERGTRRRGGAKRGW